MEDKIIINESFAFEDDDIFDKIESKDFESPEMLDLKVNSENLSKDTQINELISYSEILKNLTYDLSHQPDGALRILRDFNGSGLLADEVGLGKTITAGIVLKESIARGLVKKALILTPPSLVDQWCAALTKE